MKIESPRVPNARVYQILKLPAVLAVIIILLVLIGCTPKVVQPIQPENTAVLPEATAAPAYLYQAVLDQKEPIVAGKRTSLNILILDEFGKEVKDLEARGYGKLIYYAYIAVASRDLSSLQADPVVVDPFIIPIILQGMQEMTPGSATVMPPGTEMPLTDIEDIKLQPKFVFPTDGQYILFVDIKPPVGEPVTLNVPIDVGSAKTQAAVLTPDTELTKSIGDVKVTLKVDGELKAGKSINLVFEVVDAQGKVITEEIEPQSGENCVVYVIDEEIKMFLRPDFTDHAQLQFSVNFPNPGKYKLWFEFISGDQPLQTEFVLDVK